MSSFTEAITAAQGAARPAVDRADRSTTVAGPEVQLSVRLPEAFRTAVADAASGQGLTVTAFVQQALRRAVAEAGDSFAGLADDLARNIRAELRAAVRDGNYRETADEVERQEAWS